MTPVNPLPPMTAEEAAKRLELINQAPEGALIEINKEGQVAIIGGFGKFVRWLYSLFTRQDGFANCRMNVIAGRISELYEVSSQNNKNELLPKLQSKLRLIPLRKQEFCQIREGLIEQISEISTRYRHPETLIQKGLISLLGSDVHVEKKKGHELSFIISVPQKGRCELSIAASPEGRYPSAKVLQDAAQKAVFRYLYDIDIDAEAALAFAGEGPLSKNVFQEKAVSHVNTLLSKLLRDHGAPELQFEGDSYIVTQTGITGQVPFQYMSDSREGEEPKISASETFQQLLLSICRQKLAYARAADSVTHKLRALGLTDASVRDIQDTIPSPNGINFIVESSCLDGPVTQSMWISQKGELFFHDASIEGFASSAWGKVCDQLYKIDDCVRSLSQGPEKLQKTIKEFLQDVEVVVDQWLKQLPQAQRVGFSNVKIEKSTDNLYYYTVSFSEGEPATGSVVIDYPLQYEKIYRSVFVEKLLLGICGPMARKMLQSSV